MRSHIFTLLLTLGFAALPALANIYPGDLYLSTQAEVDAASIYTGTTGTLSISGDDIINLTPLNGIVSVGKTLDISGNSSLITAENIFPNLTSLGYGISCYSNTNLISISGFNQLTSTGDNIDFWDNTSLERISGFHALHTVGHSLEIGGQPKLTQIPKFESLKIIRSSLFIRYNDALTCISSFEALEHIGWSFNIQDNAALDDLKGFYHFFNDVVPYSGGGTLLVEDNGSGLPNPTTVGDIVASGPVPAAPVPSIQVTDGEVLLEWTTTPDCRLFYISYSEDLVNWVTIGLGDSSSWNDTTGQPTRKFYRLMR